MGARFAPSMIVGGSLELMAEAPRVGGFILVSYATVLIAMALLPETRGKELVTDA
jgi:hypothetical protein